MLTEQIKIIKLQKQAVLQLTAFWHMMNVPTDCIEPMLVLFRSIQKSLQHRVGLVYFGFWIFGRESFTFEVLNVD